MNKELKPCPFCGDQPEEIEKTDNRRPSYVLKCHNCGLSMWDISEVELIDNWNMRDVKQYDSTMDI